MCECVGVWVCEVGTHPRGVRGGFGETALPFQHGFSVTKRPSYRQGLTLLLPPYAGQNARGEHRCRRV